MFSQTRSTTSSVPAPSAGVSDMVSLLPTASTSSAFSVSAPVVPTASIGNDQTNSLKRMFSRCGSTASVSNNAVNPFGPSVSFGPTMSFGPTASIDQDGWMIFSQTHSSSAASASASASASVPVPLASVPSEDSHVLGGFHASQTGASLIKFGRTDSSSSVSAKHPFSTDAMFSEGMLMRTDSNSMTGGLPVPVPMCQTLSTCSLDVPSAESSHNELNEYSTGKYAPSASARPSAFSSAAPHAMYNLASNSASVAGALPSAASNLTTGLNSSSSMTTGSSVHHALLQKDSVLPAAIGLASAPVRVVSGFMDSLFQKTSWSFSDSSLSHQSLSFSLKTKREDSWHFDIPQRLFWTSHYVLRVVCRSEKFAHVSPSVSIELVHADSFTPIHARTAGTSAITGDVQNAVLESAQNNQVFMNELSIHFHTHSFQQGNAPFRFRVVFSNGMEAFSPPFRVLARRPASDGQNRVYNSASVLNGSVSGNNSDDGSDDDQTVSEPMRKLSRKSGASTEDLERRCRIEKFFSNPNQLTQLERAEVVTSFLEAFASLPAAERAKVAHRFTRNEM
eukprot:ANDGO_06631.mRNA.1 hypothetical protein